MTDNSPKLLNSDLAEYGNDEIGKMQDYEFEDYLQRCPLSKVQFFLLFDENLLTTGHKYDTNFLYILLLLLKLVLFTCFGIAYPFAEFFQLVGDMGFSRKQQT